MAHRRVVAAASATALLATLIANEAVAQPSGQDVATAQALFDEGKRLMQAGKFEEGCPKLVESQRLDPGGGTLLVIAMCHEGQGKTATAWAEFGVALGEARKDKRADRENAALDKIRALEPKLTRVRVNVANKTEGLEVRRDGSKLGDAQWGTALPVDPGDHLFEARAPGKKTWSSNVAVKGEGATIDVAIPKLEDDPGATVAPVPVVTPPPTTTPEQKPPPSSDSGQSSSRLTWVVVAGGIGVVATGVGAALGFSASARWDDAQRACPNNRCTRPADTVLGEQAGTRADISTTLFVVGGLGIATAAVLFFTMPRTSTTALHVAPTVGRDGAGINVGGAL